MQNPFVRLLDDGLDASSPAPACRPQAFYPAENTVRFASRKGVALNGAVRIGRHLVVYDLRDDVMKSRLTHARGARMRTFHTLALEEAHLILDAAQKKAEELGLPQVLCVETTRAIRSRCAG